MRESLRYDGATAISMVWWMQNKSSTRKINVIESMGEQSPDTVLAFHSTAVMNAWSASGVWFGYPALTESAVSLTRRACRRAWNIIHKLQRRGFTFGFGRWDEPHTCGEPYNCPSTLRSAGDAGCTFIPFPFTDVTLRKAPFAEISWKLTTAGACIAATPHADVELEGFRYCRQLVFSEDGGVPW
ncbi:hypothetical protein K438DRAFT_1757887 [Mycena galopus ATCC 62051]|nr:hypothetical protein K438DRAFT_1757887 [Mycena galopus ATCC 62051]